MEMLGRGGDGGFVEEVVSELSWGGGGGGAVRGEPGGGAPQLEQSKQREAGASRPGRRAGLPGHSQPC